MRYTLQIVLVKLSIVVETTDTRYKAIKQTLPALTTDTRLDTINMHSLYIAKITVVGENGLSLNGASVTLGSETAIVINGIAQFPNTSYATGVNLKASFGGQSVTETVSLGYTSYSKTVTLPVDEIFAMKPVPNGNIQILAKASSTSARQLSLSVRGWSGQNATIDWGDGSTPEVIVANKTYHTYSDLSYYNIEISNATNLTMADLEQTSTSPSNYACVVAYWTIGNSAVRDIFSSSTRAKTNLAYLGDDVFINDAGRTEWKYLLRRATKLVNIPASLKDALGATINLTSCFEGCSSLTSIPAGLFDKCVNVTSFYACFEGCSSLTSIPAGLFDKCVNVTSFVKCFKSCTSLTSIPVGLFDNFAKVTNFYEAFAGCTSLTSFPVGLFDNCVNAIDFRYCFTGCSLVYCEIPPLKLDADRNYYLATAPYLTVLVSNSLTPPIIGSSTLPWPFPANLKIYVPDASVTAYKAATNWVSKADKIYPLSEYDND